MKVGINVKTIIKEFAIAAAVSFIIMQFIRPVTIMGRSMEPTLSSGDRVFVSLVAYKRTTPERGDIVVFKSRLKDARGKSKTLIKRVVALPGEKIRIEEGRIIVDGKELVDNVSLEGMEGYNMSERIVDNGCYFCIGDNRLHSTDSRSLDVGTVPIKKILGRVVYRYFPLEKMAAIKTMV